MSSFNLRAKKNLFAKAFYSLLNSDSFLVFFHNNKRFTAFRSKILFQNLLKSYVIKNTLFYNITGNPSFRNLVSGPTGFISFSSDILCLNFFRFYFKLSRSGDLDDVILLAVYWPLKGLFFSLEYIYLILNEIDQFHSLTDFIYFKHISILNNLLYPFINFVQYLNNLVFFFLLILNNLKEKVL